MTQTSGDAAPDAAGSAIDRAADAIIDFKPTERSVFLADVLSGLSRPSKAVLAKYLYDDEGSRIFDRITETKDYYPTRTEASIFREHVDEMADAVGERALVIEPGAGSGEKAVMLLGALHNAAGVVPVDISMDYVERSAKILARRFPEMEVLPLCADFTEPMRIPATKLTPERRLVFFPGSTVGNFQPPARRKLMRNLAETAGPDGLLLIGFDLRKDRATLEAAYDDDEGVTARFNHNLLERINRELDADFSVDAFRYVAEWHDADSAVHMYLESSRAQTVSIDGRRFDFDAGERIHTESSYKFTTASFAAEAGEFGMQLERTWLDDRGWFAVGLLRVAPA